ncbi:50S ribosomal protein L4 [Candidatus Dependentiae bacterium]|nr:50S ribosomal protein L4 [Candidatus Dependentiae bacterium]
MAREKLKAEQTSAQIVHTISSSDLNLGDVSNLQTSPDGLSLYVRALRQNWRQGTVGCKDRGEVAFSNRKPWKQKGTGRARAGSLRSPLWRKGGVIFGPQPRVRTLKVSKDLKKNVFSSLLIDKLRQGKIFNLDFNIEADLPKTSLAFNALKSAQLHDKKIILFVPAGDFKIHAAFSNLPNVGMLLFDQPNAYDLANCENWVVLKKDMEQFKEMVSKWI